MTDIRSIKIHATFSQRIIGYPQQQVEEEIELANTDSLGNSINTVVRSK